MATLISPALGTAGCALGFHGGAVLASRQGKQAARAMKAAQAATAEEWLQYVPVVPFSTLVAAAAQASRLELAPGMMVKHATPLHYLTQLPANMHLGDAVVLQREASQIRTLVIAANASTGLGSGAVLSHGGEWRAPEMPYLTKPAEGAGGRGQKVLGDKGSAALCVAAHAGAHHITRARDRP